MKHGFQKKQINFAFLYNHENIADRLPESKETVIKVILKELGISFKAIKDKPLTQEEKHIVSALKQADLLKEGKLQTVDAKKFLNELR